MRRKLRIKLWMSLFAVAVLAILFARLRPAYDLYRTSMRRPSQIQRGTSIILAFQSHGPVEVPAAKWKGAIRQLHDIWKYTDMGSRIPGADVDDVLDQMQSVLDLGKSGAEEGDLLAILDLIAHMRATNELRGDLVPPPYIPVVMPYDALFVNEVDRLLLDIAPPIRGISNPRILKYALRFFKKPAGDPLVDLSAALDHPDWRVRAMACRGLGWLVSSGRSTEAIPILVRALKDPDPLVRERAAEVLRSSGPAGAAAVPALADVSSHDPSITVRQLALQSIAWNGLNSRELGTPALIAALRDPEPNVRSEALNSLGFFRSRSQTAMAAVIEALASDRDSLVRSRAAIALVPLDDAGQTVPALVKALNDENSGVRDMVAKSLLLLGRGAIPALQAVLRDQATNAEARPAVEQALAKIQGVPEGAGQQSISGLR
jgi:HEAT repeat protein